MVRTRPSACARKRESQGSGRSGCLRERVVPSGTCDPRGEVDVESQGGRLGTRRSGIDVSGSSSDPRAVFLCTDGGPDVD